MTETPKDQSEDIDLLALVERSFRYFKKYKWVFLSAIILGLITGYYFYRSIAPTYKSKLILHSYFLTNQEQIQVVNNWNQLLKKKEYAELAGDFHCPQELLYNVKELKAQEIQQVYTPSNPNGFTIDAIVTDNAVLDSLQAGIVYGFENSEYTRDRVAMKKQTLQELIGKTSSEIGKLDSTKRTVERIINGQERSGSSIIIDGANINRQLIDMNEKLLSFRESFRFIHAVEVLQSFSKFRQPANPKLIPWLIIGLLGFLGMAWITTIIHSVSEKLKLRK